MKMMDTYHSQIQDKVGGNDDKGNVDASANSDTDYDGDCGDCDDNDGDGTLRSA